MLAILRNKSNQKKIFLGIAILVIPSFLIFGIVEQKGSSDTAGKIAGRKITTGDFLRHYEAVRREMYLLRGIDPRSVQGQADFEKLTWERLLLLDHAKRAGIKTSDKEVLAWIAEQPAFSPAGTFSPELYKIFVERQLKLVPRQFEEEIRDFLTLQKSVTKLAPEAQISDEAARKIFAERRSPRDLRYVVVAAPDSDRKEVNEDELKQLYGMLGAALTKPETRSVKFVAIAKGSEHDKPEVKEALKNGFGSLPAGLEAKESGFLKQGEEFPGLGYMQPLSEAVFGLAAPGERTAWIENDKYSAIAELVEVKKSAPMPYEEAAPDLRKRLQDADASRKAYDRALNIRKAMIEEGFDAVAKKENLPVLEAKGFKSGDSLDKAGVIANFDASIAPLAAGQISEPVETPGGFVIVEVSKIGEPAAEEFEKEKPAIVAELGESARNEAFAAEMAKLWATLEPNQSTMSAFFPEKYEEKLPPASPASAELAESAEESAEDSK